ncbi:MAG: tetratricopeptide repeat protein [Leptolyngbyaceae cyanobacterium SM2_3_12]|nr:tetratricopeptide repeat protein [Leptolyngbyaceae cyanobacterium SM2_3_12]
MGQSIVVTQNDFETAVLRQSFEHPVLVDFYATWCGPCQLLKPVLDKLAQEYDITVAKVDIDQNPDLAKTFAVEGVPDVRIITQGQVLEGFVGMVPEAQIRQMLSDLGLESTLEQAIATFKTIQVSQDAATVQSALTGLLTQYPESPQVLILAAQTAWQRGDLAVARQYLDLIPPAERDLADQAEGLRALMALQEEIPTISGDKPLDQEFLAASQAALAGDYGQALETYLTLVQKDRRYRQDGARKAMLTVFKLLGDSDPLTVSYRKRLMQALY